MADSIRFGTDGWRAVIAEDFTFDNVRVCAQAVAAYLRETVGQGAGVVVGYDTRFASEDFAAAVAEVLAANDVHVYLTTKAEPTPVVSHAVVNLKADGGIVITASHNPGRWNGFKYKARDGASAPMEVIAEIERHVSILLQPGSETHVRRLALSEALARGLVEWHDPAVAYVAGVSRLVDLDALRQMDGTVVVDSMFGAGSGYFAQLLGGGRLVIDELNGERNPLFPGIRPEPITPNLARLRGRVPEVSAVLGIATDGDADRVGIVDEQGRFMTQHQVFGLLCHYLLAVRQERGHIVRSVTTTDMISLLGQHYGAPVHVTAVGFKYIAPLMLEYDALVGGDAQDVEVPGGQQDGHGVVMADQSHGDPNGARRHSTRLHRNLAQHAPWQFSIGSPKGHRDTAAQPGSPREAFADGHQAGPCIDEELHRVPVDAARHAKVPIASARDDQLARRKRIGCKLRLPARLEMAEHAIQHGHQHQPERDHAEGAAQRGPSHRSLLQFVPGLPGLVQSVRIV